MEKEKAEKTNKLEDLLSYIKNLPGIAQVIVVFMVATAVFGLLNEFSDFRDNYFDEEIHEDSTKFTQEDNESKRVSPSIKPLPTEQGAKKVYNSSIAGRLIDANREGIENRVIETESGDRVVTNINGYFELAFTKRPSQVKVRIMYKKEGLGGKERYVGVNQKNLGS